ncbi:MAG: DUF3488 and transglutaminase-like domain-containing protein [Acidimicrobiia bacterium]|nr:DUF3488 and transglutaminase-like domain-containing protein [Acidimicrobiia bacterium]
MNRGTNPPIWLEVAAALLVPAAAVGFSRVFELSDTVFPIIGAALVSSAIAIMCRRLRLPLLVTAIVSMSLLSLLVMNRYAPGTARFGVVPTGETVTALRAVVDELVVSFQELKSPVPAVPAFVAAAMVGAWIMAFLTDWGAMRLRLAFEPVFPSGLLFIFTSIPPVSAEQNRITSTFIYATAIAVWAVAQRVYKLMQEDLWLPNHERRGPFAVGRLGSALAAMAVIAGTIIGANLPWADADPVYSFSPQQDPTRVVVSPFVNIRSRLVDQTNVELFTVTAEEPSYWRIAGLDTFEDDIWKVAGNFSPEDGDLPGQDLGGNRTELVQSVSIKALAAIWLPAAFAPSSINEASTEVTWNSETSSLTVANDVPDSDGVTYTVVSKVPAFSADELRAAPNDIPDEIAERYLDVPDGISPTMLSLARDLTADSTNRYDQMRALQDHFRGYRYEVQLGPRGDDPIETFLAERQGFCQQFAGTFALMARSLGVPSRVATGFTWGDQGVDEQGRTVYTVTGRHTHAWPEVYFQGLGWVPFEPTPGRGLPGASPYSGHTPAQDSNTEPTLDALPAPPIDPGVLNPDPGLRDNLNEPVGGGTAADQPPIWQRIDLRYLLIPAALGAYMVLVLGFQVLRRRQRRARSTSPDQEVTTSWTEAVEAIELGFETRRRPSETRTEFAGRLRDGSVPGGETMQQLAELSTVARFHPSSVTADQAHQASVLAAEVAATMGEHVPIHTQILRRLDPRRGLSALAARATGATRTITTERISRPQPTDQEDLIDVS